VSYEDYAISATRQRFVEGRIDLEQFEEAVDKILHGTLDPQETSYFATLARLNGDRSHFAPPGWLTEGWL
jgi:hypothetical protein